MNSCCSAVVGGATQLYVRPKRAVAPILSMARNASTEEANFRKHIVNIHRMAMKLRIAKNSFYKRTISRLKLRYKKYYRILVDKEVFQQIKYQDDFVASIQLARFTNTIRAAQRSYLRIPDDGRLPNTKDRIEQQYVYASII